MRIRGHIVVIGAICLFSTVGCSVFVDRQTMLECPAPDDAHVAYFVVEAGGGAAGFVNEFVEIGKRGSSSRAKVMELTHAYGIVLTWRSPTLLEITYPDTATVTHWENVFDLEEPTGYPFHLREWKTILREAPSSKSGSFLGDEQGSLLAEQMRCVR